MLLGNTDDGSGTADHQPAIFPSFSWYENRGQLTRHAEAVGPKKKDAEAAARRKDQ